MRKKITVTLLVLFAVACAGPKYFTAPDFAQKAANHKLVAVLPFQMIMTGKKPEKLTDDDIAKIEEGESRAFQMSLYNNILRNHTTKKGTITIEIQPYEKTNQLFKEKGIDLRKSWEADPQELCKILGVDAVVKTRVQKTRYMSDLAAYGIDLGYAILSGISWEATVLVGAIVGPPKTNDIDAQCSLFNGADGSLLWKDMYKTSASWNAPANDVIEGLTNTFGYHFPYRKKAPK